MIKLISGNSWWRDYSSNVTATFTADWSSPSWAIAAADDEFIAVAPYTQLASGAITVGGSVLQVRVPGSATVQAPGNYVLALQFKNTVSGFCQELHLPMAISQQVIV